jgi:KaiC/GvpD/RAD55 family RecA-like ATPase
VLKEGKHVRFRNERKRFYEFVDIIAARFPQALSADRTLEEPFKSLTFLVVVGQRPITSLMILEMLLKAGNKPLNGKEVGEKLAEMLAISPTLTTKGGNYKDRIGDVISALVKIGVLESVFSKSVHHREEGFRIKKSEIANVEAFIDCIRLGNGLLHGQKPSSLETLFKARFDQKLRYVLKSGTDKRQPFSIGKILKSLLNPRLGVSFETAIRVIEDIEPELKTGISTLNIQSMLYRAIKKYNEKAAENYRLAYPGILSIRTSEGKERTVNYRLVKDLIDKEVKLKLTSSLLDRFASTLYNVIARHPENYQNETAIREYLDALIRSEFIPVRSDVEFVKDHLVSASSALDGCRDSLQSDEISSARDLFKEFLEQMCLVTVVEFGYLPFKDASQNADLISNLLKHGEVKNELMNEFRLSEEDLSGFQRVRFMVQMKDNQSRRSLEKLMDEGEKLIALSQSISKILSPRIIREAETLAMPEVVSPSYVSTGYKDLDDLMFGGIPENYAVLLTSPSCDERNLLIERFLETGVRGEETVFQITIDARGLEALAQKYASFYLFLCNPEADAIIESRPNVFKLKGVENLTEIDIALTTALRKVDEASIESRRACIEIVSDILLQHHAVSTRRWLTALIPKLKSLGFTTLAVMNPHMHAPQEVEAILDLFQGEISLYRTKTDKGFRRFLRIEKLHNLDYSEKEVTLKKEKLQKK